MNQVSSKLNTSLCFKYTIKNVKRQPTEWERKFAKHTSGKELVSKLYKIFLQLTNNPILKWAKDPKRLFSKVLHTSSKHMGKMLDIISHLRMHIKPQGDTCHTHKIGHLQKDRIRQVLSRMWRNWNPHPLRVGMQSAQLLWKTVLQFLQEFNVE